MSKFETLPNIAGIKRAAELAQSRSDSFLFEVLSWRRTALLYERLPGLERTFTSLHARSIFEFQSKHEFSRGSESLKFRQFRGLSLQDCATAALDSNTAPKAAPIMILNDIVAPFRSIIVGKYHIRYDSRNEAATALSGAARRV